MKKVLLMSAVFLFVVASVIPAQAHSHGHFSGSVWIGPGWGWWGPPAYSYYYRQPVVAERERVAPVREEQPYYWYFCPNAKNYYPYVKQCPGGWLKVLPPPGQDDKE